ncbi:hypothetical protein HOY82DRAFT_590203 [Tuber indicum]|nr:hypothetical protein HOY82DRAFT_590203 [Tuber indicum]
MHTPIPTLLLFSALVLATTTTTAPPILGSHPTGPPPPPPSPSPSPQPPPRDLTETYEPNPLTHFVINKLSTPRKWRLEKPPTPPTPPASSPPPPPSSSATPGVTRPVNNGSPYTDPVKLQRFVQDLRANRRPSRLRGRGIKSSSQSLPLPGAKGREVESKELTEAEFNAMFEEYKLKHDVAVGSPPKGERQKKWGGTKYGGYIEALMSSPRRGRGREVPQ